jgi:hypothetical protein
MKTTRGAMKAVHTAVKATASPVESTSLESAAAFVRVYDEVTRK